ncbi:MAG: hypothetical protein ABIG68_09875 [Acidobacteriota bacterium]
MKHLSWQSRPEEVGGRGLRLSPRAGGERRRIGSLSVICLFGCLGLAMLVIFAGPAVSGAHFVWSSSNPGNVFTAGTFRLLNSVDGGYVINVAGLRPDQSVTGTLTLTCQGNYPGAVSMTNGGITNSPSSPARSAALTVMIEDITGTPQTLYNGTMSAFASLALTPFSAGQTRTYRFTVTFPQSGAVPGLQGAACSLQVRFVGVVQ